MNPEKLARALAWNPEINNRRPIVQRPARTQRRKWARMSEFVQQNFPDSERMTQPRVWLDAKQAQMTWAELHPEWKRSYRGPVALAGPPTPPPAAQKRPLPGIPEQEEEEILGGRGDEDSPSKKPKIVAEKGTGEEKGKGVEKPQALKATRAPPSWKGPGTLPLSPQDTRAPRAIDAETEEARRKWPGPGTFEYNWKNNPNADPAGLIRNSITRPNNALPQVRNMPVRKENKVRKNFKYMGDQAFYSMEIEGEGNCFFHAVSMALYGTTQHWHIVKYHHLYFFRYVLTHPGHPRYDAYWRLNSNAGSFGRNMWQQLSIPGEWQSSELFNVTADIYNLFIVLYEQLPRPAGQARSVNIQDNQTIGLFGQYNATHLFFHILNRNHYQPLIPRANPEVQFPLPDETSIKPNPGRYKMRPFGGQGRSILPPPIAQPMIPQPEALYIARVLGINKRTGALDIDLMTRWLRKEKRAAAEENDPTSIKWWLEGMPAPDRG